MRDSYVKWAHQALRGSPKRFRDFQDVLMDRWTFEVIDATGLPGDEAAWLAGVTAQLRYTHPGIFEVHSDTRFLYEWAKQAPNLSASKRVHINERRFQRWLENIDQIDQWYENTIEALKVIKNHMFDIGALYDIAKLRADSENDFVPGDSVKKLCALDFYTHQPKGENGKMPEQQSITALLHGREDMAL